MRASIAAAVAVGACCRIARRRGVAPTDYPVRPITLMLPLGAGGAMDILARAQFEPKLKERLGKPVVIENRTGGGTVIAATAVAKAPPDGYTLFFVPAGTLTTNATLYKKLPYDPAKDFTPIALTSTVRLRAGGQSVAAGAFDRGAGRLREGAAGPAVLRLDRHRRDAASRRRDDACARPASKMTHVPYRGMPQAVNDVVGDHVQMVFADPAGAPPLIKDGKLRALAVSSRHAHRLAAGRADAWTRRASRNSRRCRGT